MSFVEYIYLALGFEHRIEPKAKKTSANVVKKTKVKKIKHTKTASFNLKTLNEKDR